MADNTHNKSGSNKRQRNKVLQVRLTDQEFAEVQAMAEAAGLTPASLARGLILSAPAPRARRRPTIEAEAVARLLGEFGKVGSNLNQIAYHLNAGDGVSVTALEAALRDVAELRAAALEALGRKA